MIKYLSKIIRFKNVFNKIIKFHKIFFLMTNKFYTLIKGKIVFKFIKIFLSFFALLLNFTFLFN